MSRVTITSYDDYAAVRLAAEKAIGRRGLAALERECIEAGAGGPLVGTIMEIVGRYRRKGVTKAAGRAAAEDMVAARSGFAAWRRERREEIRQEKLARARAGGRDDLALSTPSRVLVRMPRSSGGRRIAGEARVIRTARQLAEGLEYGRRTAVAGPFERAYQHGGTVVEWVDDIRECGVEVSYTEDWDGYSRRCKYPKREWSVTVRAMRLYRDDIPGGHREIDGLVTLAAVPVELDEDTDWHDGAERVWRAVWAEKSRGVSWNIRSGYIMQTEDGVVHGRTVAETARTMATRVARSQADRLFRLGVDRRTALRNHGMVRLNWRIARAAGLCPDGIRSWAATHFPERNPEKDSVTVREALGTRSSETLVLSAVAVAVKRAAAREGAAG